MIPLGGSVFHGLAAGSFPLSHEIIVGVQRLGTGDDLDEVVVAQGGQGGGVLGVLEELREGQGLAFEAVLRGLAVGVIEGIPLNLGLVHAGHPGQRMHVLVAADLILVTVAHVIGEDGQHGDGQVVLVEVVVGALDAVVEQPVGLGLQAGGDHAQGVVGLFVGLGHGDRPDEAHAVGHGDVALAVGVLEGHDGLEVSVLVAGVTQRVDPGQGGPVGGIGHDRFAGAHLLVDGGAGVHRPVDVDQALGVRLVHPGQVFLHAVLTQPGLDGVGLLVHDEVVGQAERRGDDGFHGGVAGQRDQAGVVLDVGEQLVELVDGVGLGVAVIGEDVLAVADAARVDRVVNLGDAVDAAVMGDVGPAQVGDLFLDVRMLLQQAGDVLQSALRKQGLIHGGGQGDDVGLGAGSHFHGQLVLVGIVLVLDVIAGLLLEQLGDVVGVHVEGLAAGQDLDGLGLVHFFGGHAGAHHQDGQGKQDRKDTLGH